MMDGTMVRTRARAALPFALLAVGLHWLAMRAIDLAVLIEGDA